MAGLSAGVLLAVAPPAAEAQSFDCRKAATAVEKMICADAGLSALDEQMANAFAMARDYFDLNAISQAEWLKTVRNRCASTACLKDAYEARISHLYSVTPMPKADGYYYSESETFSPG